MRRAAAALAVLAVLGASACGGGDKPAAPPVVPSPTAPVLTAEAAKAAATDITLRLEDMPLPTGYTAHPTAPEQRTQDDVALSRCLGEPRALRAPLAVSTSPDFQWGQGLQQRRVSSDTAVVASDAEARHDLSVYTGPKALPCLSAFLVRSLRRDGSMFGSPEVARVDTAAPGMDGSFGYELRFTGERLGVTVPLVVRVQGFLSHHTEVTLLTFNAGQPFPETDRAALLDTLVARASRSAV